MAFNYKVYLPQNNTTRTITPTNVHAMHGYHISNSTSTSTGSPQSSLTARLKTNGAWPANDRYMLINWNEFGPNGGDITTQTTNFTTSVDGSGRISVGFNYFGVGLMGGPVPRNSMTFANLYCKEGGYCARHRYIKVWNSADAALYRTNIHITMSKYGDKIHALYQGNYNADDKPSLVLIQGG